MLEEGIKELWEIVNENGGKVYLEGEKINEIVGMERNEDIGEEVWKMNMKKKLWIKNGGGGKGVGKIGVEKNMVNYMKGNVEEG